MVQESYQLSPPKQEIMDACLLDSGFHCILQLPTGSGKTWLAERAIESTLSQGHRAIYLTPLRALAQELLEKWKQSFSPAKVGIFTGEYSKKGGFPISYKDAQVLIMTPERLDACTRRWRSHWNWFHKVDLVVVDEFHLLGEVSRGARLEGTLLRWMRLNPFSRLLGLSATLGNRIQLAQWLQGIEYTHPWRATPIQWVTRRYRKATDKAALLAKEVQRSLKSGGQSLVFVQSRLRAEQLAKFLTEQDIPAIHHHAGLESEERQKSEDAFRSGTCKVAISTGTLEMGVNLPARQVILYDLQRFDGIQFSPLSVNTVWQRAGRAGRRGLDKSGEVVLLLPSWERKPERYLQGQFEPVLSQLQTPSALAEQILTEVSTGLCRTQTQLKRLFDTSLAHFQDRLPKIAQVLEELIDTGMLQHTIQAVTNAPILKATKLGRIAVRQMLNPATLSHLAEVSQRVEVEQYTYLDLLLCIAYTPDCQPLLQVNFEALDQLSAALGKERSFLLSNSHIRLSQHGGSGKKTLATIKTALVLRAWTRTGDQTQVAEEFGLYPFELRRLLEQMERILTAWSALLHKPKEDATTEEQQEDEEETPTLVHKVASLQQMLSYGIHEEAVTLTLLPNIGGTLAKRLLENGISDLEELAEAEPEELAQIKGISFKRAESWIELAGIQAKTQSAYFFRETGPILQPKPIHWPSSLDPYRFRRALDLAVKDKGNNLYEVTGGLEPHRIELRPPNNLYCDCMDFEKGNICKHILATRLFRKEAEHTKLIEELDSISNHHPLDLFALWFESTK